MHKKLTKTQLQIFQAMGASLLGIQTTEKFIKTTITYILPRDNDGLTFEKLAQQNKEEAKKTLGYFIGELRKRSDIHPDFDLKLSRFLELRNDFIHNFQDIEGFDLLTPEGHLIVVNFLNVLMGLTDEITKTLFGLGRAWQKQNSIRFKYFDDHILTKHIDDYYVEKVDEIFYKQKN